MIQTSIESAQTLGAQSLQDRIRLALEEDLRSGQLQPGMAISEQALCARFTTSRTPVREALLLLAARGMVSIRPRAGIYVRHLDARELVAMMEGLAELEGVLARLAAHRINANQKERLANALEQTARCAEAGDSTGYERANVLLHDVIYEASGNAFIVEQAREVRLRIAPYRGKLFEQIKRLAGSHAEHEAVVQAILRGDSEAAAEAMRDHISAGGRVFADMILRSPPPAPSQDHRRKRAAKEDSST